LEVKLRVLKLSFQRRKIIFLETTLNYEPEKLLECISERKLNNKKNSEPKIKFSLVIQTLKKNKARLFELCEYAIQ
jgi:hypothetical protein